MPAKKDTTESGPKRPKSAYMFFCEVNREAVKAKLPADHKPTEVMKSLGAEWKALDEAAKKPYEAKAKDDKERYSKEKTEWDKTHPKETSAASEKRETRGKGKRASKKQESDDEEESDEEEAKPKKTAKKAKTA